MRVAGLVLGLLGGVFGFLGALFAPIGGVLGVEDASTPPIGLGFAAVPFAILGVIGGAMALARPKISGIMLIISAVGGIVAIPAAYLLPGILLLVGGILCLKGQREIEQ